MNLNDIRALVTDDMTAVDALILRRLSSSVALINQLGNYIVGSGGKRLRPLLVLLSAGACGYRGGDHHVRLAAIVEFIHTATLLHDDVVDASELRRGRQTANALFGNEASVLVGDFLYSRAFEMMVEVGSMRVMEILAGTTNTIAEGEVMQLLNCHDADTTEERYMDVIRSKTAKLFEAGVRLGAVISGHSREEEEVLAEYGMRLGTAFQLVDDVLDYGASSEEMGKNMGDDLAEGKPTLPLIHVMRTGTPVQAALVREAIEQGGRNRAEAVLEAIHATGALEHATRVARTEAEAAIAAVADLPDSPHHEAMVTLARFAVDRKY